ncbi:GNAT family N-acetyltransferase [Agrobacterium phage OLIVR4]|nr:GNAT family N-acetyltransferase [Agrobacterium phage OLIVR4]
MLFGLPLAFRQEITMIEHFEKVSASPAVPHILIAMKELFDNGFYDFVPPDLSTDEILVEMTPEGGNVIGFMIYRPDTWRSEWFIMLSWTDPGYRRRGIHSKLFAALCERAKTKPNVIKISCATHVDNHQAQASFEAQGRKPVSISYEFRLDK